MTKDSETKNNEEKVNTEVKNNNETKTPPSKEGIQAILEKDTNVSDITWSNDKSKVAYAKKIVDIEMRMYIFKVGEEKENEVEGVIGNLHRFTWSPDDRYVTINEGFSSVHETIIVSLNDLSIADKIVNADGLGWAPDSSRLAFAVLNDKKPSVDMELGSTLDLMIYDLKSKTKTVVLKADHDFNYSPISWDNNGLKL